MNLYDILNVPYNASKNDIKKAYYKLIIQHHPDKIDNPTEETYKKFHEIQTAYEILYDEEKRKEYDIMSHEEKMQIYDLMKQYFTDIRPQYFYIYNSILNFIYANKEEDFKNDVNSLNIKNIFNKLITKIKDEEKIKHKKKYIEINDKVNNLQLSLKDRYNNSFKYIRIPKTNNTYSDYLIPLFEPQITLNDPDKGTIVINITYENNKDFEIINKHDLFHIKYVSLSQYIYGGDTKIYHVNDEILSFNFDSCLEKKPVFKLDGKGLLNDSNSRGDLYIYLKIEGVHQKNDDDVYKSYTKLVEETIKLMFPQIDS
jgi:DnaJ-class molecular chaperone